MVKFTWLPRDGTCNMRFYLGLFTALWRGCSFWRSLLAKWTLICMYIYIWQAQSLGSCQRRCNSKFRAVARRDFSSASLVTQPLGLSCGFSPPLRVFLPPESAPEIAGTHEPVREDGAEAVIGRGEQACVRACARVCVCVCTHTLSIAGWGLLCHLRFYTQEECPAYQTF